MAYQDLPQELQENAKDAVHLLDTADSSARNAVFEARRCGDMYMMLNRFALAVEDVERANSVAAALLRAQIVNEREARLIRNEGSKIMTQAALDISRALTEKCHCSESTTHP